MRDRPVPIADNAGEIALTLRAHIAADEVKARIAVDYNHDDPRQGPRTNNNIGSPSCL